MPVLQSLPVELLRQIVSYLDDDALEEIGLISPFFNDLAVPFFLRKLGAKRGWLIAALSALVTRPELACHVRSIRFGNWVKRYPSPENCVLFNTMAAHLVVPDIGWRADVQAVLLLHLVPDVQVLGIDYTPRLRSFIENTLTTPLAELPFKSLVTFYHNGGVDMYGMTLPMLIAVMRMPSIRCIHGNLQGPAYYKHPPSVDDALTAFAGQSTTTDLILWHSNIATSMLARILRLPRALTKLVYVGCDYIEDPFPLGTALRVVQPTLQSLYILGKLQALDIGLPTEQTIGSLHDWEALTSLSCTLPALLGSWANMTSRLVDLLPPGIRRFEVRRNDYHRPTRRIHERWTVMQLVEQLVGVLQERELEWLEVETCGAVYRKKPRKGQQGWDYQAVEEAREQLEEAAAAGRSRGCEIVCS